MATELATPPGPGIRQEILVALDGAAPSPSALAASIQESLTRGSPGRIATVLVARTEPEIALVDPASATGTGGSTVSPSLRAGGIESSRSVLGTLLLEVDRRGASAAALLTAGAPDETVGWVRLLLAPILERGFEYVCPAYQRQKLDGMLTTAILYPLTRALYGWRLRQPAGGEAAFSLDLASKLVADPDWRRDPSQAGSDAWLVGKVLSGAARACQAWLGAWPSRQPAGAHEDASHALARLVGPVFREMERHAGRWQRVEGSRALPTFGEPGILDDGAATVDVGELAAAFALGTRELPDLWGLVLPPATLLALRRAAAAPPEALRVDDALWARIVYDFAVAHYTRTVERQQLLRGMTPLYLGWVAGFVNDVRALDAAATEARVEALCMAFEREKPYAISRWRWPDSFNP